MYTSKIIDEKLNLKGKKQFSNSTSVVIFNVVTIKLETFQISWNFKTYYRLFGTEISDCIAKNKQNYKMSSYKHHILTSNKKSG